MAHVQEKIGNSLLHSLVELKTKSGELNIDDVEALFNNIASSIEDNSPTAALLQSEIEKIAAHIAKTRQEIGTMNIRGNGEEKNDISQAGKELNEVVNATEEATNRILDNADLIQDALEKITDEEAKATIAAAVNEIYEASNFQDITGQRIAKVVGAVEYVEYKIDKLLTMIGGGDFKASEEDTKRFEDKRADAELCNGPQAAADAASQDDIDALFND